MFTGPSACLDKPLETTVQDGATSHIAHTTLYLLQAHGVNVLSWPSKLLDLNPIDHFVTGKMVRRRGPVNVRQLQHFVMDEWSRNGIAQTTCLRYMAMHSRCQAVILAKGRQLVILLIFL